MCRNTAVWVCRITVVLVGLITLAPAKEPSPPTPDSERGHIGLTVKRPGAHAPTVFFVRVEDDNDVFNAESVIRSNWTVKKHIYLLNAEPGRYVAVAANTEVHSGGTFTDLISEDTIPLTEITVVPGRVVFMGHLVLKGAGRKLSEVDPAQAHYLHLIRPELARLKGLGRAWSSMTRQNTAFRVALKSTSRDADAEREFWSLTKEFFPIGSEWQDLTRERLEELSEQTGSGRSREE